MKLKFSLKNFKFKELLLQHAEKGVLAIGVVCLLMFLVSAAGREKLPPEREPDRLRDMTQQTKQHVEKSTFSDKLVQETPPEYANRVRRDPVLLATYDTPVALDGPIVDAKLLRDQPPVLAVRDLRVNTGFAPFALLSPEMTAARSTTRRPRSGMEAEMTEELRTVDRTVSRDMFKPPKDAKMVVKYWAMITGLIPIREQKEAFYKTFELAAGFDREADLPNYLGYQVERAEVGSGYSADDLKWTPISLDKDFMLEWAGEVPEPVQPEYITPKFVTPLGPRVGSIWEDYVAHLPQIPLEQRHGPGMSGIPSDLRGDFQGAEFGGGETGYGSGEGTESMTDEEAAMFESSRIRRNPKVTEEDPEERRRRAEVVGVVSEKQIKGVDFLLFRFCDFSVEPSKKYVYRVRIGLSNPNKDVPVKNLRKAELRDPKPLISDWSKPTAVAAIPYGDKLLAGAATPPTLLKEPIGKIRIVQVKSDIGAEVPLESDVLRGSLANFMNVQTEYVDATGVVRPYQGDFITDSIVLDVRGGKPLLSKNRDLTEPGELLVLTRDGKLLAMHEFEGEDTWVNYAVPEEETKGNEAMEMNMEMEMEREMERGLRPGARPAPKSGRPGRGDAQPPGYDPLLGGAAGPPGGGTRRPARNPR